MTEHSPPVTAPPTEPSAIVTLIDAAYADLRAALHGLTTEQKLEPEATGRWRVKDVLAHLGRWNEIALAEMQLHLRGETSGEKYRNYLDLNDVWEQEDLDLPLAHVEERFATSHARIVRLLTELPAERCTRFIQAWARNALWHHYPEHTAWLRDWRTRRGI
jgi:hypothetical protein